MAAELPSTEQWGYAPPSITPEQIVQGIKTEATRAVECFEALPECEPSYKKPGYWRVFVEIPIDVTLFDQLMNGPTGYRAHYSASVDRGEAFNRSLVEVLALAIVEKGDRYSDKFSRSFCSMSLTGRYSKLWYSKELTDLSTQAALNKLPEEIALSRWRTYWQHCEKPRKGLLAPKEPPSVLLNGTFVDPVSGDVYEQKPERSSELYDSGWV